MVEKIKEEFAAELETATMLSAKHFKDFLSVGLGNITFSKIRWNRTFQSRERWIDGLAMLLVFNGLGQNLITNEGLKSLGYVYSVCCWYIMPKKNIVLLSSYTTLAVYLEALICFINSKFCNHALSFKQVSEDVIVALMELNMLASVFGSVANIGAVTIWCSVRAFICRHVASRCKHYVKRKRERGCNTRKRYDLPIRVKAWLLVVSSWKRNYWNQPYNIDLLKLKKTKGCDHRWVLLQHSWGSVYGVEHAGNIYHCRVFHWA